MAVPDTNTFSLNEVRLELGLGSTTDLSTCFKTAIDASFDLTYKGTKDRLSNFRNYNAVGEYHVSLINIRTDPWYSGTSLDSSKHNYIDVIYKTISTYTTGTENITRGVFKSSDDSEIFTAAAVNASIYRTSRPLIGRLTTSNYETVRADTSAYFKITANSYWNSINDNIPKLSGNIFEKEFNILNTYTSTLSVGNTSMYFDADLDPIDSSKFNIACNGDWFVSCANMDMSVNKWWGTGNDTLIVYVNKNNIVGDISIYNMANIPAKNLKVTVYASKVATLIPIDEMWFTWDGNPFTVRTFNVSTNFNWTSSYSGEWGYYITPNTGNAGVTTVNAYVPENYGEERTGDVYIKKGANTYATKAIYQEMYPA